MNRTYVKRNPKNLICNTIECKNWVSLKILGTEYEKKTYEQIGSKTEYIALSNGISLDEARERKKINIQRIKKDNPNVTEEEARILLERKNKPSTCSLEHYMERYGKEEGARLYRERCDKISRSATLEWHIQKYGDEDGRKIFFSEKNYTFPPRVSGPSILYVRNFLDDLGIDYQNEKIIKNNTELEKAFFQCDFFLPEQNIVIEFFGDYWHANPSVFKNPAFYNKSLKKTVDEIWKKDKIRLRGIEQELNCSILVLWESTAKSSKWSKEILHEHISFLTNTKTVLFI